MAMGITPYKDYSPPWWFRIVQVAKFYGCHPEDILTGSSFWVDAAAATAEVEEHMVEIQRQRSR